MLKLTIHSTGEGKCGLTNKECDGLTVTFDDGTCREGFLSWRAFKQICSMKLPAKVLPKPAVPMASPTIAAPAAKVA